MTTKRCQECKHFNGFDGVGELWTLCSLGDFIGTKIDCSSFERKITKADLLGKVSELERKVDEQQATINELEKNYDDLVNWASEIAKRNVVLDEQVGELQRENKKLKEEEKLYAQEILRLNTLLKQYQSFKDLGGDY